VSDVYAVRGPLNNRTSTDRQNRGKQSNKQLDICRGPARDFIIFIKICMCKFNLANKICIHSCFSRLKLSFAFSPFLSFFLVIVLRQRERERERENRERVGEFNSWIKLEK
jgi:hypothetical protein